MAVLSWGLLAAVCAMCVGFSEAQSPSITAIPAIPGPLTTSSAGGLATSTAEIVATTTVTVSPATSTPTPASSTPTPASSTATPASATASPSDRFYTYLKVSFKSVECTAGNDSSLLNSTLAGYFTDEVYDFVNISLVKRDICNYTFTLTFGPNIEMYNIREVLEDKLKNLNATLKLTDVEVEVDVPGVELGEFTVGAEECEKICCGAGGQITLTRSCSPSRARCRSYKLKKEERDCVNVCPKKCSGMICKISVLVLLFGAFMNWFLK